MENDEPKIYTGARAAAEPRVIYNNPTEIYIDGTTISRPAINGVPIPARISMSKTEIDNLIAKLNSAKQKMESIWHDIKNNDFQRITNSWAGKDCQTYMSKIEEVNLTSSFEALELLANTYKKASDKIEELQNENVSIIQSM